MLEIVATQLDELHVDVEVVFAKFRYAEWLKWNKGEIQTIRNYFHAFWCCRISQYINPDDDSFSVDELLCSLGQCEDDLLPYLNLWIPSSNENSINNLSDFICENANALINTMKLENAFWQDRGFQMNQIIKWLISDILFDNLKPYSKEFPEAFDLRLNSIKKAFHRLRLND
jgi:hypothetical protein